ncbi:MAG: shikimate dehydrogenase, partial [Chloroflexota bacterium]
MSNIITQTKPTMYFFGVTTGQSSSRKMFPHWANILKLKEAQLVGVDLPINAPPEQYRDAVLQ